MTAKGKGGHGIRQCLSFQKQTVTSSELGHVQDAPLTVRKKLNVNPIDMLWLLEENTGQVMHMRDCVSQVVRWAQVRVFLVGYGGQHTGLNPVSPQRRACGPDGFARCSLGDCLASSPADLHSLRRPHL